MDRHDAKIMETQINDNFKNNKKPINLISDKVILKGMIIGINL